MFFQFQVPCPKKKTADTNAAAVAVQGSWSLTGSTFIFPMEKSRYFWSNSQFKVSREVVSYHHTAFLLPLVWAFCSDTNLAFTHGLIICNSKFFCSLFYLIFGVFPGPARPNLVFPRGHVPTPPFFFTVTFESYGLSWTWRSLPVPWLCYKYLSRPPKYMQGPCTNSLVFVRFLSVSSFHCHHSFIHSIIQKKWGSPLNFKPNSWDWSCKIILPTKRSTKKHLYPIESMYGIFAHIWLILMVNNWYIYRIPVPWILWGVNHHPQDITPENLRAFEVLRAFTRSGPSRGPQSGWKHRHQCAKERTGGGQNGLMGRNSRRSQHIDNIEYPPGNDRILPPMEEENPFSQLHFKGMCYFPRG